MSWTEPDEKELEYLATQTGIVVIDKLKWYKHIKNMRSAKIGFWIVTASFYILLIAAVIIVNKATY